MAVKVQQVNELSNLAKKSVERKKYENPDTIRKTSNDELKYLQDKYKGYSFVAADYKKRMKYGSVSTTNVVISPSYLRKMANDPTLEAKTEKQISAMKDNDKETVKTQALKGNRITSQCWSIDKNGTISKWCTAKKNMSNRVSTAKSVQSREKTGSSTVNKFAWKTALSDSDRSASNGLLSSFKKKTGI